VVEGAPLRAWLGLMRDHTPKALRNARKLRKEMSFPEVLLWRLLRGSPQGIKFCKQHPIGIFVADFYCDSAKIIIEIDGIAHDMENRPERDGARDAWLERVGRQVIRIPARDVLADPQAVAESLVALCIAVPPPSALRAATSPDGGGWGWFR
jgi:very-short-patch-repair endonuclease